MPAPTLCQSHEERVGKLESSVGDLKADIAGIDQRLKDLTDKVGSGFESINLRLDQVCVNLKSAVELTAQVEVMKQRHEAMKRWSWKLGLPVSVLLLASAAGVHGPKLVHLLVSLFGE